jgi:cytochrome b
MATTKTKILVWDSPTRVFHWLMVFCFAGAYLTSESSRFMGVHLTLGYTMVGLVAFRVVWGVMGTRYARFSSFVRGPSAVVAYASDMLNPKAEHPVGHNPVGAVSIVLMLLSTLVIVYTGWIYFNGGAHSMKEIHEGAAALMLTVVGVHVAGVIFASMMQQENLPLSMLNGFKQGRAADGIRWSWWPVALVLLCCVLGFWWQQWQAPSVGTPGDKAYQSEGVTNGQSGQYSKHSGHKNDDH